MIAARRAAPVLLAVLLFSGCAHTFDARSVGVPVTMASAAGQPPQGQRFAVTNRAVFGLWGILSLRQPSLRKALAGQLADGTGIADVRIRVRSKWSDLLVSVLTLGLVVPRAVTFEGVVTK